MIKLLKINNKIIYIYIYMSEYKYIINPIDNKKILVSSELVIKF